MKLKMIYYAVTLCSLYLFEYLLNILFDYLIHI